MSDTFTVPPFVLNYDIRWISLDLNGDLTAWAGKSAKDVLARWGARGGRREKNLAKLLEDAGTIARRADDTSLAYLLYPALGEGIRTIARVLPVDMRGQDEASGWEAMLRWQTPADSFGVSADVTDFPTPAGACKRIRFQHDDGDGAYEHYTYAWVFPRYGAGIVLTGAFSSVEAAEQWRTAVDDLAAGAELDETAG
jgi:hypothetical protein